MNNLKPLLESYFSLIGKTFYHQQVLKSQIKNSGTTPKDLPPLLENAQLYQKSQKVLDHLVESIDDHVKRFLKIDNVEFALLNMNAESDILQEQLLIALKETSEDGCGDPNCENCGGKGLGKMSMDDFKSKVFDVKPETSDDDLIDYIREGLKNVPPHVITRNAELGFHPMNETQMHELLKLTDKAADTTRQDVLSRPKGQATILRHENGSQYAVLVKGDGLSSVMKDIENVIKRLGKEN